MYPKPTVFVRILVPFCAGIGVLRYAVFAKLNLPVCILLFTDLILLFTFNYLYRSIKVYHHKHKLAVLLYLLFFLLGALSVIAQPDALNQSHFSAGKAAYLKIYVADEPTERAGYLRFKARVIAAGTGRKMKKSSGLLMVSQRLDSLHFTGVNYGRVYLIPARWHRVQPPANPAEFDSRSWLANQQIYHQVLLSSGELIPLQEHRGSAVTRFVLAFRKQQVERYRKLISSDEAFAVAATLILGYRADLDAETIAAYSKTGTIHALSVSGMHVAMVYMVLEFALGWMNRKKVLKWLKMTVILALIWYYTLVTGCSASVLRSAIMITMLILTKSLHKNTGGFHILALSAFCLLFSNPNLLWDAGFQLSYLAVCGLIYLHPKICKLISFRWWLLQQTWSITSVSIAATLFTFPLSIYYFHQFPVYFLLSNLFIAVPVAVLMYGGLAILLFRCYFLAPAFEWLLNFMNHGLECIASLPYSAIQQIWITKTELAVLCAAMLFMMNGICDRKKQQLIAGLFLCIIFQGMLLRDKTVARQQMTTITYALRRNYATAFLRSDKAIVLTDLSPKDKLFKFHIQPSLDQRKISSITCIPWDFINRPEKYQKKQEFHIRDHQLWFRHFKIKFESDTLYFENSTLVFKQNKASLVNLK